jgi:DNA polymerase-3 subunit epsilon
MGKFDKKNLSFIDIETPNRNHDRICSIAIIATKNDLILSEEYYLVNPEGPFSDENIRVHKITPSLIKDKPAFPEVWEAIKHYFTNGIILSYNTPFDLGVLCKTLSYYNIDIPDFYYICTMDIAKRFYHKSDSLENLCNEYGLTLDTHHNTFYNALACRNLFSELQKKTELSIDDEVKRYQFNADCNSSASDHLLRKAMNELNGIVHGLASDNAINADEISALRNWMDAYGCCVNQPQFAELERIILNAVEDGIISKTNLDKLQSFTESFQFKRSAYKDATQAIHVLTGLLRGLVADSELNEEEILSLRRWMDQRRYLSGNYSFNKIDEQLNAILEDGIITQEEKNELFDTLNRFAGSD